VRGLFLGKCFSQELTLKNLILLFCAWKQRKEKCTHEEWVNSWGIKHRQILLVPHVGLASSQGKLLGKLGLLLSAGDPVLFSHPGLFRRPLVFTEPDACKGKNIGSANCCYLPTTVWSSGGASGLPTLAMLICRTPHVSCSQQGHWVGTGLCLVYVCQDTGPSACGKEPVWHRQGTAQNLCSGTLLELSVGRDPLHTVCVQVSCNGILPDDVNEVSLIPYLQSATAGLWWTRWYSYFPHPIWVNSVIKS